MSSAHNFESEINCFARNILSGVGAVVVAQLVQRSLPTPDVCHSNPVISKLLYVTVNCIGKIKMKKKRPEWSIFKNIFFRGHQLINCRRSSFYFKKGHFSK